MTVQRIDERTVHSYGDGGAVTRQGTIPQEETLFRKTFARLMSAETGGIKNGQQAADAAELIGLEMMRSALAMDSTTAVNGSGSSPVNSVLAIYDTLRQNVDAQPEGSSTGGTPAVAGGAVTAGTVPVAAGGPGGCPSSIDALIGRASRRYGVDAGLIKAVVHAESDFKPTAMSPAGAQGLMQLMPSTAAGLGVTDPFDPEQNIMGGTRFLKDLLNRYGGDLDKTLAAYNWGPGNLSRGRGHLPKETRDYLVKVKRLYDSYRSA